MRISNWALATTLLAAALVPAGLAAQTTTKEKAQNQVEHVSDTTKDSWLTAKTKIALFADDRVSGTAINVSTKDHVVTLRGKVGTEAEKQAAVEIAKTVEGVASVKDQLQVVPTAEQKIVDAKDDDIKDAVKKRIKNETRLKKADIAVRVDKGVVTLTGDTPDLNSRVVASQVVRNVPGVRAVRNELQEKSS